MSITEALRGLALALGDIEVKGHQNLRTLCGCIDRVNEIINAIERETEEHNGELDPENN